MTDLPVVNLDADQRNADWIKTLSWDLPRDKDTFLAVIGGIGQLPHFLTLPAAEAMPEELKTALDLPRKPVPVKGRLRAVPVDE